MATGMGLWSNQIVPHLIESGAIDGPMAAGKKTLQRLRWLFIVAQFGGVKTQRHCIKLGNAMLMHDDFFSESNSDFSETNTDDSEESDEWTGGTKWPHVHEPSGGTAVADAIGE